MYLIPTPGEILLLLKPTIYPSSTLALESQECDSSDCQQGAYERTHACGD